MLFPQSIPIYQERRKSMLRKISFIVFLLPLIAQAQEKLSLQDALGMALKNNYSILISKNDATIAKNDNTTGNAGMLPSVAAGGNISQTKNNLTQNYTDGRVVDKNNVGS